MKKLILAILLISLILIDIKTVYADTYIVSLPELPTEPSGFEYYYIKKNSDNEYNLYWLETSEVYISGDNYYFGGKWWGWSYRVTEDINNHVWANRWGWYNGASTHTLIMPVNGTLDDCNIIYSNFDIKYNDTLLRSKLELNTEPIEPDDTPTLSGIGGFFTDLKNSFTQLIQNLGDRIWGFFSSLFTLIQNVVTSIVQSIVDLPQNIIELLQETIIFLFKPDSDIFNEVEELVNEKFNILFQVRELIDETLDINLYKGTPHFEVTYQNKTYELIDFSMFNEYRVWICAISSFLMIFDTIMWLIRNAPNIVNNGGADTESIITNHYNNNGRIKIEL